MPVLHEHPDWRGATEKRREKPHARPSKLLSPHATKAVEYLLAISYLLLFIPFWRFVQAARSVAQAFGPAGSRCRRRPPARGHAWAKTFGGAVAVGLDDFAHKLIGPLDRRRVPDVGTALRQGQKAFTIVAGRPAARRRSRRSTATSSRVNEAVRAHPAEARPRPVRHGLAHEGRAALADRQPQEPLLGRRRPPLPRRRRRKLASASRPQLGVVLQDGGTPVHGIAREIDPETLGRAARAAPRGASEEAAMKRLRLPPRRR